MQISPRNDEWNDILISFSAFLITLPLIYISTSFMQAFGRDNAEEHIKIKLLNKNKKALKRTTHSQNTEQKETVIRLFSTSSSPIWGQGLTSSSQEVLILIAVAATAWDRFLIFFFVEQVPISAFLARLHTWHRQVDIVFKRILKYNLL